MNNILDFTRQPARSKDEEDQLRGKARCLHCRHEWQAVTPVGKVAGLECPECNLSKGVMVGLVGPADEELIWKCECGCKVFYLTPGTVNCLNCGASQTGFRG